MFSDEYKGVFKVVTEIDFESHVVCFFQQRLMQTQWSPLWIQPSILDLPQFLGFLELSQGYSLLSKENMHNQAEEHLQITVITLHCSNKKGKEQKMYSSVCIAHNLLHVIKKNAGKATTEKHFHHVGGALLVWVSETTSSICFHK